MRWWIWKPGWALALVFVCLPAYGMEWYEMYEEGRKAVEKGDCPAGVPLLQEALKSHPDDDLRARPYGLITIEYIPHFYLAECALKDGDLKLAGKYIRAADDGGVPGSKKKKDYENLKRQYDEKKRLASSQEEGSSNTGNTTGPVKPDPAAEEAARRQQMEQQRQAEIRQGVADAQQAFLAGRFQEARQRAQAVLNRDPQNATARRILSDIDRREAEARDRDAAEAAARMEKQRRLNDVRSLIRNGDLKTAESRVVELQRQYPSDPEVTRLVSDLHKQVSDASDDQMRITEKQVIVAFFSGNYEAAIEMADLNEPKFPESWRLPYYRGCAYATLALLDTANRESRESAARGAFRKAKEILPSIPDNPYISPRILELFRSS